MSIKLLAGAVLLLLSSNCVVAQDTDTTRGITIDDYFQIKTLGDPQVSPEGDWVAYTVTSADLKKDKSESRVWMVRTSGGDEIPMTAVGSSASKPRWSPDGTYLSFQASRNDGKAQVWVLNRLGGEAQQLTDIKQGITDYAWAPDGRRLVLTIKDKKPKKTDDEDAGEAQAGDGATGTKDKKKEEKPEPWVLTRLQFKRDNIGYLDTLRTHLYVYHLADSSSKQITFGPYDDSQATWSPTADEIAFTSNRTDEPDGNSNRDIWVVSADTAQAGAPPERITGNSGSDSAPAWNPDGDELTYVSVIEPELIWYATDHLATASRSGENETVHTADLDRSVAKPKYSSDGEAIYFLVQDHGMRHLASLEPKSGDFRRLISGELSVTAFSVSQSGATAALIAEANRPAEIFILDDAGLRQITHANDELLSELHLASTEKVTFASKDGTEIEAFVVKPPDFNSDTRYPTILWIHGGPVAQFEYGFRRFEPKLFAENGYVVVMVNPRGSVGYGQDFAHAIWQDWGNKDYEDVIAAIDHVIELGYADPDRLGVGGWSYGGMLTDYVITKTTRFAGAISGASEAFYRANYGHDHYQLQWELEMGLPWENPELWDRISPFTNIDKVETPTLFMGGEKDWNVPIMNSEQLYQAVRRLGIETQLVVYPGEHHGIRRPSFQRDRFERYLGWFGKYVK